MKIRRYFPAVTALAILMLTGCKDNDTEQYRGPADFEVEFSVKGIKDSPLSAWQVGNMIGVYTVSSSGVGGVNSNEVMTVKEGSLESSGTATFTGVLSIDTPVGTNEIYAYYPYASNSTSQLYDAVSLTINASQTMSGDSFDPNYEFMYSSGNLTATSVGNSLAFSPDDLNFHYVVGFINLKITGFDDGSVLAGTLPGNSPVSSVSLIAKGNTANPTLSGNFVLDLSNGDMSFGSSSSNTVTVNCPQGATLKTLSAWAVTAPFELSGGDETVTISVSSGDKVLIREIAAQDIGAASLFSVTAGKIATIEIAIDDSWRFEDDIEGKVRGLYLVENNVGTGTLCVGWEESVPSDRNYIVQLFTDKNGEPVYTSPTLTYKTNNTLYSASSNNGCGPTRFTVTELEPNTTYYIRVKHASVDDEFYSDFIEGRTLPVHTPVSGEVFYEGFDKLYWGSDPINSASGVQPSAAASYNDGTQFVPVGWDNLTRVVLSDGNTGVNMVNYGAFSNENDYFGLKGWRYTNTTIYPGSGYIKLGSGSVKGSIRTPAMGSDVLPAEGAECTLSFRACPYVLASNPGVAHGLINVFVVHSEADDTPTSTTAPTDITNILSYAANQGLHANDTATEVYIGTDDRTANYQWTERTFTIPNLKPTDKIWFLYAGNDNDYRFLLDEILIVKK